MLSAAGSASAGRKGWPPQRRSTGSAGALTTTTSQASVALRSLTPAFNWIATAFLPCPSRRSLGAPRFHGEGWGYYSAALVCSASKRSPLSTAAPVAPASELHISRGRLAQGSRVDRRKADGQRRGVAARPRA